MNTLLATNILLSVIVLCIIILTSLLGVILVHIIGTTRRIKNIVKEFDDDIHRTRSFFLSVKEYILDLFKKK